MATSRAIGLLCQHFYPEMVSTGLHMTELATGLAERGWLMQVYCAAPERQLSEDGAEEYNGVRIRRIKPLGNHRRNLAARLVFALSFTFGCLWRVARDRSRLAGLIVTTNPPFVGLAALAMRMLFGMRYLVIVYDVFPEVAVRLGVLRKGSLFERLWDWFTRRLLRSASHVVVIGRDMEEIIGAKVGSDGPPITLIPNWSDARCVHPIARDENPFVRKHNLNGRIVVQYAGNMGRTHNIEVLLDAAALLREQEKIVFLLIGDGARRERLQQMALERNLTNVRFLPFQPYERLAQVLSAADIAVVVLERGFEGLSVPSKTYGAMAAGVAILGLIEPHSEIGRTIIEEQCGIVVEDPTGPRIARVINELANEPHRLAEMGANARAAFLSKYSLTHAVERYDSVLGQTFGRTAVRPNIRP
jgi:glycosyltransferase involved in cell wall biosynthesis